MEMNKTSLKDLPIYDGNKYQPPFDPELDAIDGVTDEEMTRRFKMAIRMSILAKRIKRVPIARFDEEKEQRICKFLIKHRKKNQN